MDTVIDNLARAIRRLAGAGVGRTVVTADHGHVFFPVARDESMKTEAPGGATVDLHRRCWIGRGGATPAGTIRVSASALGYAADFDLVFPRACGVLRRVAYLAFHHGAVFASGDGDPGRDVTACRARSRRPAPLEAVE